MKQYLELLKEIKEKGTYKPPAREGIDDSFKDGINYFKLAYCNHLEEKSI